MAACLSGRSSPILLRVTYDELVAYADELEKKKEKKHSKKKNQDTRKEKDTKAEKQSVKKDSTDVSDSTSSEQKIDRGKEYSQRENKQPEHRKSQEKPKKNNAKKKCLSEAKPKRKSTNDREDNAVHNDSVSVNKRNELKPEDKYENSSQKETQPCDDETGSEDYDLELRARTGGVLKLCKSPGTVVKEPKGNSSQPRGIIKLPQGFDFNDKLEEKECINGNDSAKKRTLGEGCGGRFLDDSRHQENPLQRQDGQSNTRHESPFNTSEVTMLPKNFSEEEKVKTRVGHGKNSSECKNTEDTPKESESGSVNHVKVEKKVKSMNLQRAQKLLKMVLQKETALNNLLSRDMLDKAAFEKINSLTKEIQEAYKGIMMLDLTFAVQQDVDQNLWKNGFYKVIETLRKYAKLFLGFAEKKELLSPEEINNCLKEFLENAETFYKNLLDLLQKGHEFSVQEVVSQPRKAEKLGKKVSC